MTKFLVSARKYRPQTFSELVSQDHVGETLRNAIRLDRLAHAYLFCGPRGVGKTSAARILAKMVNCLTPADERSNLDPCGTCESCKAFGEGRSLNVIEIDAASNNSVDDVRALRETVRIPPQIGSKKVYIIDEVHMLSKQAFNALLKTLEEPPPYVQFLFATTEPQKVIPTILSRCQRFDFRRISINDIAERLREICETEGITADEASLRLIARKGDGALRDAFSAFDQAVLLCGKDLQYASLVEAFGTVDIDVYFETADLIAARNRAELLHLVERLVGKGYDLTEYLTGLTDHFRDLLVAVTTGSTDLIETDHDTAARYAKQAATFSESDLLRHLIVVDETQETLKWSVKPRLRVELALLKMASLAKSADLESLLRGMRNPESSSEKPKPAAKGTEATSGPPPEPVQTTTTVQPPTISTPSSTDIKPNKKPASAVAPKASPAPKTASTPDAEPTQDPAPAAERVDPSPLTPPNPAPTQGLFGKPAITELKPKPAASKPEPKKTSPTPVQPIDSVVPMATVETGWDTYIRAVMNDRIHVGALLQHASPLAVVGQTVEIAVPDDFHERLLGSEAGYLADKLATTLSLDPAPAVRVVISEIKTPADAAPELDAAERVQRLKDQNPVIAALIDKFGGEVVW